MRPALWIGWVAESRGRSRRVLPIWCGLAEREIRSVGSAVADPVNGNNTETENTLILADQLLKDGFE